MEQDGVTPDQREWTFGSIHLRFEPPDLLRVVARGPRTLEEIQRTTEVCRQLAARQPFFVIADVERASIDAEVKRYIAANTRSEWLQGIIYVGAGFLEKAMVRSLAVALFLTGRWKTEIHFASSEAEAREIVSHMRAKNARAH